MSRRAKQVGAVAAVVSCCIAVAVGVAMRIGGRRPPNEPVSVERAQPQPQAQPAAASFAPSVPATAPVSRPPPAGPLISEFMAANKGVLKDGDGKSRDWVEVHNPSAEPLDLEGWHLTDDRAAPTKWRFPAATVAPRGYLVVFASGKDAPPNGLHANFKLDDGGGYLALVEPDGRTVASEFAPAYPKQAADISYGLAQDVADDVLVAEGATARVVVPADGKLGRDWVKPDFDDSGWTEGKTGVGYDTGSGYRRLLGTDVQAQMFGVNATVYVRIPFEVNDARPYQTLSLRVRYDDGFIAYLNGQEVASAAAPQKAEWNSRASSRRADDKAAAAEEIDLDRHAALLRPGRNVLAVHGLNRPADSGDMLILPELRAGRSVTDRGRALYFPLPTPGAPNGAGVAGLGPVVKDLRHTPAEPGDAQDLAVTAAVTPFEDPVASVALHYRVMFEPEAHVPMLDDGAHGDGAAGDGVFGAAIPADAAAPGQMIRYRVTATDRHGNESAAPRFADPLHTEQYAGTVVAGAAPHTRLPVLQWFVEHPERAARSAGTRACVFFGGEFYDNVFVRKRGVSSSSWPKPNYKFDFPRGHHFRYAPGQPRVEEFDLQSTHSDKSYVRQVLAWETFRDAGAPYCVCFPLRVQQNGRFHSVVHFVEHPDERYLKRLGLDPDGAMYKFVGNSGLRKATGFEKKNRLHEGTEDIEQLVDALAKPDADERLRYLFDHVDVPQVINYLAACVLVHDNDAILKNFFMYRDGRRLGGWKVLPWDKDLTFGRNHIPGEGVLNDTIWADHPVYSHPLAGDSDHPKNHYATAYNALTDAIHDHPVTRQMFLRRLRTLMDQMLQPPGTDAASLRYERRLDDLYDLMSADVALDRAKWGNPYGQDQDFAAGLADLKARYFAVRRAYLYQTHGPENGGIIPDAQPADAALRFAAVETSPDPAGPMAEYVEVTNPNDYAVDASGWRVDGSVEHVLPPGTVIPARGSVYLCADPVAFRARTAGPRGGRGLFVQGGYAGRLPRTGARLRLTDGGGRVVATSGDAEGG